MQVAEVADAAGLAIHQADTDWTATFGVDCQYTYCRLSKINDGRSADLITDGTGFWMYMDAVQASTYEFTLSLADGSAATYVRMTMVPENFDLECMSTRRATWRPCPSDMEGMVVLGSWGETADGDETFEEYRPSYDMKEFRSFPGVLGPSTDTFSWVAPTSGLYYMVVTTNCDEPVLDDVEANMNLQTAQPIPGREGASSCHGEFTMELQVAGSTTPPGTGGH